MADTTTATAEAPTSILTTPLKEDVKPEAKLFTNTSTGTEAETAGKAAADKAAADKAASEKATTQEKATTETKASTGDKKLEDKTTATTQTDYTLVLPENSLLSADDLATLQKEAKESGLSKEEAEEVLKSQNQIAVKTAERVQAKAKTDAEKAMADAKVLWKSQIENDSELGGEHLAETALLAQRGYAALVTPEDKKFIEQLGLDHTPAFIRMMAKVGKLIGEDNRLILGQVGGVSESVDPARKLYGKTTPDATGKISG